MNNFNWTDIQDDMSKYQADQTHLDQVKGQFRQIQREHQKRVEALFLERLQPALTSGLTRGETRLNKGKILWKVYPDERTEWLYDDKVVLTEIKPQYKWNEVFDEVVFVEGVII